MRVLFGLGPTDALELVGPVVETLLGVWLLQACARFQKVARTDEADQLHLLEGFRKLRGYMAGQVLIVLIGLLFGILAAFVGMAVFTGG
jgi:hypothetical protein